MQVLGALLFVLFLGYVITQMDSEHFSITFAFSMLGLSVFLVCGFFALGLYILLVLLVMVILNL